MPTYETRKLAPREGQCTGWSSDGRWSDRCNRDAKPGEKLCGLHLAGKKRSEQAMERLNKQWDLDAQKRKLAHECGQLQAAIQEAALRWHRAPVKDWEGAAEALHAACDAWEAFQQVQQV